MNAVHENDERRRERERILVQGYRRICAEYEQAYEVAELLALRLVARAVLR